MRDFRGRNLNKDLQYTSISEFGVSQIARISSQMRNAPYDRAFPGLMLGIVIDDKDSPLIDNNNESVYGVIRVYLPGYGAFITKSVDEIKLPDDEDKVYTCFPIHQFGGVVVNNSGVGSAYGMTVPVTKNTVVAVLMANADTKTAFWIGSVPYLPDPLNTSRPIQSGDTGGQGGDEPDSDNQAEEQTSDGWVGYANVTTEKHPKGEPSTRQLNFVEAGLIADPHRGAPFQPPKGVSQPQMFSIQTPGIPEENRNGHTFIMSDSKNFSHIKLMSGEGNQLLISDRVGSIYINTKHGKNFLELREDGSIDIFAEKSIKIRSMEDIVFTADRDIMLESGRDLNQLIKGKVVMDVKESFDITIGDGYKVNILEGGFDLKIAEYAKITAGKKVSIKSGEKMMIQSSDQLHIKASSTIRINSDSTIQTQAGADSAEEATEAEEIKTATSPGPPTPEEYRSGKGGSPLMYVASRDGHPSSPPQHEPFERSDPLTYTKSYDDVELTGEFAEPKKKVANAVNNQGNPTPRSWRNNNPGALENASSAYAGRVGKDGPTTKFQDMKYGFAAQTKAWSRHMIPGRTPRQVACSYVNGDPNSTAQNCSNYGAEAARYAGVDPDTPLTEEQIRDPDFRFKWQKRAACWETGIAPKDFGTWYNEKDLTDGLSMEGITKKKTAVGDTIISVDRDPVKGRGTRDKSKGDDHRDYKVKEDERERKKRLDDEEYGTG